MKKVGFPTDVTTAWRAAMRRHTSTRARHTSTRETIAPRRTRDASRTLETPGGASRETPRRESRAVRGEGAEIGSRMIADDVSRATAPRGAKRARSGARMGGEFTFLKSLNAPRSPSASSEFDLFEQVFREFDARGLEGDDDATLRLTDMADATFQDVMNTIEHDVEVGVRRADVRVNAVRVRDVKLKCSSCKHTKVKDVDFAPGKKTCASCLEKHRNYEQRKRTKRLEAESDNARYVQVWNAAQTGNSYARAAEAVRRSRRAAVREE